MAKRQAPLEASDIATLLMQRELILVNAPLQLLVGWLDGEPFLLYTS